MENNLEIDVKNAKELGLSYGYYKALNFDPNAVLIIKKAKDVKICPVCGEVVKPPQLKYCSKECMELVQREKNRQASFERYHRKVSYLTKEGD